MVSFSHPRTDVRRWVWTDLTIRSLFLFFSSFTESDVKKQTSIRLVEQSDIWRNDSYQTFVDKKNKANEILDVSSNKRRHSVKSVCAGNLSFSTRVFYQDGRLCGLQYHLLTEWFMASKKSELIYGELKGSTEGCYLGKKPSSSAHTHTLCWKRVSQHLIYGVPYQKVETGNAQGLGLRYEHLSVGGTRRINEVPELRWDGSHHYRASWAMFARCVRNPDDSVKATRVNLAS